MYSEHIPHLSGNSGKVNKMVIIKTKYLSPTNTRGSRIKASANGFTVTISYDYALNDEAVHYKAVQALVAKHNLDWDITNMGYGSDNSGYYFTFNHSVMGA
jgi:hypothetical protein